MVTQRVVLQSGMVLAFVALVMFGCSDQPNVPVVSQDGESVQARVPAEIRAQLDLLERLAASPDRGLSYWASSRDRIPPLW